MRNTITDTEVLDDMRHRAQERLRQARSDLFCARIAALQAEGDLVGRRARRAAELREKITDAIAYAERLMFYVESDDAADGAKCDSSC